MPATRDTGGPRKRRRKRPASTPVSRARAQERQYVSQGRAVQRTATRQRRAARSRPNLNAPKLGSHPYARPGPTARARAQQRQYVSQGRAVRKVADLPGRRSRQRYFSSDPIGGLRRKENRVFQALSDLRAQDPAAYRQKTEMSQLSLGHTAQQVAGVPFNLTNPFGILRTFVRSGLPTAVGLTRALIEDPSAVAKTSARTGVESITGIPQGIAALATHPVKAVEMIVKDYEDRYGLATKDPAKFRQRVKSEWGLTPYVLDAAAAAGGTGQAAGLLARSARFARAAEALSTAEHAAPGARTLGRLGVRANRAVTSERPLLRFSAGAEGVRAQSRSRNLFVAAGQNVLDRRRGRWLEAEKAKPGRDRGLNRAVKEGEVTPITSGIAGRSLRELPNLRRYTGRTARRIGGKQSVARVRQLTTQGQATAPIRRALDKLDSHEKVVVREMAELGVGPDKAGIVALRRRLAQLEADFPDSPDAKAIRDILEDPQRHLTQRARDTVDLIQQTQAEHAALDPRLASDQEIIRRLTPQADLLHKAGLLGEGRRPDVAYFRGVLHDIEAATGVPGLARHADELAKMHPDARRHAARELALQVGKQAGAASRDVSTAERRLARAQGQLEAAPRQTTPEGRAARQELAQATQERAALKGELKGRRGEHMKVRGVKYGGDIRISDIKTRIAQADERVRLARERVRRVESEAPKGTDAQRARVARRERELAARKQTHEHVLTFEKGIKKVWRAAQQKKHMRLEDAAPFAERVRKAAEEAGLREPAYWMGVLDDPLEPAPRLKAVGKGLAATERGKATEYKLSRSGRGSRDPEVLARGIETNIKRRFQYSLVASNVAEHAFDWSRNAGKGMTIDQIKYYLRENNIDPASIHIQDVRILQREPDGQIPGDLLDELTAPDQNMRPISLEKTLKSGDYRDLARNRYVTMPAEVGETLNGLAARSDSQLTRALEVALKQKPARILLGLANIPWLSFQATSNALLTGLGGGLNPFDIYGAAKWWKGLDPEARAATEAELGITHGHHFGMDQQNLGASNNHLVAAWRGFKATKTMRLAHRMNPLDVLFRADEIQNNFFRRTLFYSKARRAAYRRMGSNWRGIDQNVTRIMDRVMGKPPDRMAQAIAQHGPEFEATAKHVKDFLGDYLSFTPSERFLLSRNVMFYGYLRFSLRFTFYTMPVAHPIMTAILGDIGRMGSQEIRDLFGVPNNYALPVSMLGQVYVGDRNSAKRGTLQSINFGRMNPFLNSITQLDGLNQAVGLVSPFYQMLADQAFTESSFTGRDWRIQGEYAPSESERPKGYYGSAASLLNPADYAIPGVSEGRPRNRILERQVLNLAYPYRLAEEMALKPSQTDDALAWSPRPLYPKEAKAKAGVAKSRKAFRGESPLRRALTGAVPFLPKRTAAPQVVARELQKEADAANRRMGRHKKRRRKSSQFGGSSGGQFGGGGSQFGG